MHTNPYQSPSAPSEAAPVRRWSTGILFLLVVGVPLGVDFAVLLITDNQGRFYWLFQQAAPILVFAWPISIPLAVWLLHALVKTSEAGQLQSRQLLWLAPLVVLPITMLVWGAVFAHPRGVGFVRWQLTVVQWAFFATIALSAVAVAGNPGRRSIVAATALLLLLFSFSCAFTAGSSVTGDWL